MMAFQEGSSIDNPLAAALAAAAELARNGGTFVLEPADSISSSSSHRGILSSSLPSVTTPSPSPSPIHISGSCSDSVCGDKDHHNDDNNNSGIDSANHHDNDTMSGNEEDANRRMARSRERNREHARRTRRRKKAQLEALQSKVQSLQAENKTLKQSLEECRIANILVGFSMSEGDDRDAIIQSLLKEANEIGKKEIFKRLMGGKRTRFVSDASDMSSNSACSSTPVVSGNSVSFPLKLEMNGKIITIGGEGQSHLNWKTGVYTDENGTRCQLSNQQLESLRRERNRMHAKMTRDRKKSFIATIEKTIEELESINDRMHAVVVDVIHSPKPPTSMKNMFSLENSKSIRNDRKVPLSIPGVTPSSSPVVIPRETFSISESMPIIPTSESIPILPTSSCKNNSIPPVMASVEPKSDKHHDLPAEEVHLPPKKRVRHGFY